MPRTGAISGHSPGRSRASARPTYDGRVTNWETNTAILARLETFSDEVAWASLVAHFDAPLTRYVQRSGLAADKVQDVVQETLIAFAMAYRRGAYDRARGRLSAWLFGIARHELASARRKAALDPVLALDSQQVRDLPDVHGNACEAIWEEEWRRAITERCIARARRELEPATWECFALQVFEGRGAEEVAARMNLSHARVHDAKYRVTRRLRQLEQHFEDA
jgi:RNA polymerase sigma factor (sigma-70 family)